MNSKITKDIVSILNDNSSLENKRNNIYSLCKNKHKENRALLSITAKILMRHFLPIRPEDDIDRNINENISEKNLNRLKEIVNASKCRYFNAICSELLWKKTHDIENAKKAVIDYQLELQAPTEEHELSYTQFALGISRICSKTKVDKFNFYKFLNNALSYIRDNYEKPGYCILYILNGIAKCKEYYNEIETSYKDAIQYYELNGKFDKAVAFLEGLEDFYTLIKNDTKKNDVRIRIAVDYEKQANQLNWESKEHSHQIINLIHKSMNSWERTNSKNKNSERKRLAKRIIPIKELSMKTLQSFEIGPIDISKSVQQIKNYVANESFEIILYRISKIIQLKSFDKLLNEFKTSGRIASQIFAQTILDSNGRIKCIIPPALNASKDELITIMEHQAFEEYTFTADAIITRFVSEAKKKFEFSKDTLKFLVENNVFVEPDRQDTFLNGLVAGFNFELSTAMHLLMPQIEHGIRKIAEECGSIVYKTDKNGVEKSLSLESILDLPDVKECFDETFLFNLRLFYTSDYGFGMRNAVCHGLYSDKELQTAQSLAVWWFSLHICCMYSTKLKERLLSQTKLQDKK